MTDDGLVDGRDRDDHHKQGLRRRAERSGEREGGRRGMVKD
jgi:hypothetical protein